MSLNIKTMRIEAYEDILRKISEDEYGPGTQLVCRKVAEDLGVSMTPVREALNRLANDGIIESYPKLGYFTKEFDMSDITAIIEARECVEPFTAALAALHISKREGSELMGICEKLEKEEKENPENIRGIADIDQKFHNKIASISGNSYLEQVIRNLHIQQINSRVGFMVLSMDKIDSDSEKFISDAVKSSQEHHDIVKAILEHNSHEAEKQMRNHVAVMKQQWMVAMKKLELKKS